MEFGGTEFLDGESDVLETRLDLEVELRVLQYQGGVDAFLDLYQGDLSVDRVLALVEAATAEGYPLRHVIAVFRQRCGEAGVGFD